MDKWRRLFEASVLPADQREYGEEYEFGPPATEEQLAAAELALGFRLPDDVRELLSEFNGAQYSTTIGRREGYGSEPTFLKTETLSIEVPEHLRTCGNEQPPMDDLRKVVFVYQINGFGDLYGVCVEDVAEFRAGEVVKLDHEFGELEKSYPNLEEFVCRGPN